jgi:AhpC/TSA family
LIPFISNGPLISYRDEIIPADALSVMDAETEALPATGIERRALRPGAVAPDFMLPDAQGRCVRLQTLLCQGPVILVFYRGGWCPYCNLHLRGFQRALPEFQQFAAQIVAISPQLPDNSLSTQEKDELTFAVLSEFLLPPLGDGKIFRPLLGQELRQA